MMGLQILPCSLPVYQPTKFCSQAVVEGEICLVTALAPEEIASVYTYVDPEDLSVQLACCNLILITGFITKTILLQNQETMEEKIPFATQIAAEINEPNAANRDYWKITKADVCDGCYKLLCATSDGKYHKLREKDVIAIEVTMQIES